MSWRKKEKKNFSDCKCLSMSGEFIFLQWHQGFFRKKNKGKKG